MDEFGRKDVGATKSKTNQLSLSVATVRELLGRQFPHWADRPITEGPSGGAGNALFRLGDDLVVRIPLHPGSAAAVGMELTWLPWLAPQLPLDVPIPVAAGTPDKMTHKNGVTAHAGALTSRAGASRGSARPRYV